MQKVMLVLLSLVIAGVLSVILAWPVMLLWNCLMPVIFGLPIIGFWQTVGLMILARLFLPSSNAS